LKDLIAAAFLCSASLTNDLIKGLIEINCLLGIFNVVLLLHKAEASTYRIHKDDI